MQAFSVPRPVRRELVNKQEGVLLGDGVVNDRQKPLMIKTRGRMFLGQSLLFCARAPVKEHYRGYLATARPWHFGVTLDE